MPLFPDIWSVASTGLVFIVGALIATFAGKRFNAGKRRALGLYAWHTLFCIVYVLYVTSSGGDALGYYRLGQAGVVEFSLGTAAVGFITIFFASVLQLSFLATSLAYNVFGFIGLLAFDASLRLATQNKSRLMRRFATLIVLLPSVSFWSSAIGKDSISFMATGFALWAALNLKRRVCLMTVAILILVMVRPHIAGIMVIALSGSVILNRRASLARRVTLGAISIAASAVMIPLALNYAGVGAEAGADDLTSYIEKRQQYNMEGGGAVDISAMSPPLQLFTYLFRPLPVEAHSIFFLAASVDNMILLFLFLAGGWQIAKFKKASVQSERTFLWIYTVLAWFILAVTTANLGIAIRQKWMFAPILIFLLMSLIGKPRRLARAAPPATRTSIPKAALTPMIPPMTPISQGGRP